MGHPAQMSLTERLRGVEAEIAAGRAESALPRCLELATLYPRALAVQRVLGEIYLALRKPREALAALDRALAGDPEDARACCARAIVHQMHGDQRAALAWYHRACDIRPEDAALRATYHEMALELGLPPYQPGRVGLARTYMRGDLFTHAIREWEILIAENSDSARLEAYVGLVETLWRAGRAREAEAWARRTLTNAPSCLKPLLVAAVIAHDEGRDADAEPFLRRAADLDPDHRTARALFADRLGAGDAALGMLIWGEAQPLDPFPPSVTNLAAQASATASSGQRATHPAERRVNRPLVNGEPVHTGALSRPDMTAPPSAPLPPPAARPDDLPDNFHTMFKETAGMLWDPAASDPDALRGVGARQPAAPPQQPRPIAQPPQPFDPSLGATSSMGAMAPPPAIAESGFALGDTEMRRAIRWVQWLQAQGARTMGAEPQRSRPTGSLEALLNSHTGASQPEGGDARASGAPPAPPVASLPSQPSLPSSSLPSSSLPSSSLPSSSLPSQPSLPPASLPPMSMPPSSAPSAPSPSMPSPSLPPSSADLRQMFAELEPPPVVDADEIPPWPDDLADALSWPEGAPHDDPEGERDRVTGGPTPLAGERAAEPAPWETPASRPGPSPDATIEELERQGAAEGFTPFTPRPGALAAIAGGGAPDAPAAPPDEPMAAFAAPDPYGYGYDERDIERTAAPSQPPLDLPPEPPLQPASEPAPEPAYTPPEPSLAESQPAGPDPHDYAARLQQARGHRDSGAIDEAIVEYRTVVRNAPELLPDVLADVEGCVTDLPEHPELHRLLGDARIRQGDYLGALESYNRAVALSQALDN